MSPRLLFAILVAVAMLFAPLAMRNGAAMATQPADHHSQMNQDAHCEDQPDGGDADKSTGKPCCVAMCTAIAFDPAQPPELLAFPLAIERPTADQFPHSYLAKLPTPPPRRA